MSAPVIRIVPLQYSVAPVTINAKAPAANQQNLTQREKFEAAAVRLAGMCGNYALKGVQVYLTAVGGALVTAARLLDKDSE